MLVQLLQFSNYGALRPIIELRLNRLYAEYFSSIWDYANTVSLNHKVMQGLKRYCSTYLLTPREDFVVNLQNYATSNSFISQDLKELYGEWLSELASPGY